MVGARTRSGPLADIYTDIVDAVVGQLEDVDGVKEVVFGDRERLGKMATPSLWIVPESWTPNLQGGVTVEHDLTLTVVALVKDPDPQEGLRAATKTSLAAYDSLVSDRQLGDRVADIRPQQIDPAFQAEGGSQLCFAAAQFAFRFKRHE